MQNANIFVFLQLRLSSKYRMSKNGDMLKMTYEEECVYHFFLFVSANLAVKMEWNRC